MEKIKQLKDHQKKWGRNIAVVLTLICCLIAISGINKPHLNPFRNTLELKYPSSGSYSDNANAIVDNQNQRILIVSRDGLLQTVVDTSLSGSPIQRVYSVFLSNDRLYAIGANYYNEGVYLSSEAVIAYNLQGKVMRTVYSNSYAESDKVTCGTLSYLTAEGDTLYITQQAENEVWVQKLSGDTNEEIARWRFPETVYISGYDSINKHCIAFGNSQACYRAVLGSEEVSSLGDQEYFSFLNEYYLPEDAEKIDLSDLAYCIPSILVNSDGEAQYYTFLNKNQQQYYVFSNDTSISGTFSAIPYSPLLQLSTIAFYMALLILGIEALVLLLWLFIRKFKAVSRAAVILIVAIVLTSVFYTQQIQSASEKSFQQSLKTQTQQIGYLLSQIYGDQLKAARDEGITGYCSNIENQAKIEQLRLTLKTLCDKSATEFSCYASVYLLDSNGTLYTLTDTCNAYPAGLSYTPSEEMQRILEGNIHGPLVEEMDSETLVYDYDYLYSSDNTPVATFSLSSRRGNLLILQSQNAVNLMITLVALFIGVYMLFTVITTFSADLKRRKSRDHGDTVGKSMDMAGIFAFMQYFLQGLDSVIVVYVAKKLCEGMDSSAQTALISLPLAAATLASLLGGMVTPFLRKRLGDRLCSLASAILGAAGYLVCALAVIQNQIYLYTAGRFLASFFLSGVLYLLSETLPYKSTSESEQKNAFASAVKGRQTATIISALIGGYISQFLSYSALYLLGAVLCAFLFAAVFLSFSKDGNGVKGQNKEAQPQAPKGSLLATLFRGPLLWYILCYLIPSIALAGYKSYLFPLYSAGAGISALLLSNLNVFVQTFSFIVSPQISKVVKTGNSIVMMVWPKLLICACLLCFILSPNIYWAVAVLFLCGIADKQVILPTRSFLQRQAKAQQQDASAVYSRTVLVNNLFYIFQSPVLSAFVSLGMNYACAAVGGICGVLYALFGFFGRLGKKK